MGELKAFALNARTAECEMQPQKPACENHSDRTSKSVMVEMGCCTDHSVTIDGQEELKAVSKVSAPEHQLIAVLTVLLDFHLVEKGIEYSYLSEYSPPLIQRDIPVLLQSFLI